MYHGLNVIHQILEVDESQLGFQMRVFRQVSEAQLEIKSGMCGDFKYLPTRVRVFGSERLLHTENIAQTGQTRLEIQLTTLRQVRFLAVVVELEQARTAFDGCLHDTRRSDFHDGVLCVDGSESAQDRGSNFHDSGRGFGSKVEMSQVLTHGEIGFLKRDR